MNQSAILAAAVSSVVASLCAALPAAAQAQAFPNKSVRVVVPFTPGSGTDITARAITDRLGANLGQTIVVENRPGAGSTIGAGIVAKADPDGYTLLVNSSSHTVVSWTYQNLSFDPLKDFAGITPLGALPNVLVVAPSKGFKSVRDLVNYAKANPGKVNYASAGLGSATHLNAERFRLGAGFTGEHIPFKGTPEAQTEVMTGRIDMYFSPVVSALPQVKEGKLQALAVGTPRRSAVLPDLPTTIEAGVPNSDYTFWVGMFAPVKTPRDIVNKIYQETVKAMQAPDVKERLLKLGAEPMPLTPEQFDAYVRDETASNQSLVKAAGIKAQ